MIGNLGSKSDRHLTDDDEEGMLAQWRDGQDTLDIARALQIPEHVVYVRLPLLREIARQDQEFSKGENHAR